MSDRLRIEQEKDALISLNRGEITREQFLKQKRAIMYVERAELQLKINSLQGTLDSLNTRIDSIDAEIAAGA